MNCPTSFQSCYIIRPWIFDMKIFKTLVLPNRNAFSFYICWANSSPHLRSGQCKFYPLRSRFVTKAALSHLRSRDCFLSLTLRHRFVISVRVELSSVQSPFLVTSSFFPSAFAHRFVICFKCAICLFSHIHYGPEQPRIQTEVPGHSLVC